MFSGAESAHAIPLLPRHYAPINLPFTPKVLKIIAIAVLIIGFPYLVLGQLSFMEVMILIGIVAGLISAIFLTITGVKWVIR
jgi:hypothetical protein